jgi:hypothetical protein
VTLEGGWRGGCRDGAEGEKGVLLATRSVGALSDPSPFEEDGLMHQSSFGVAS